jgi:hypothetical protein
MAEIEAPVEIELAADEIEITGNVVDAYTIPKEDIEVQAVKNEYTIVGDKLYSSIEASEAPEWLTGIIDTVVGSIVNTKLAELDTAISSITTAIQEIEAVKNQYQELITIATNPDDITISRLETLDSTVADNSAQITNLDTTKTSEAEAVAISANVLDTSIDNGRISSLVTNLNTSISNLDQSTSTSIAALTSTLGSNYSTITNVLSTSAGEFSTEANAITELDTRLHDPVTGEITGSAGVVQTIAADLQTLEKGAVAANAQDIADIHAYVRTDGTNYGGATSTLGQEIASEVENGEHRTQAKFLYGSNITLPNGQVYTTGFGMTSEAVGNEANSEFWINAEKFKFTNSAQSGQVAPFTIDASGATPQVTFNGIVEFSNINNAPTYTSGTVNPTATTEPLNSTYLNTTDNSLWTYTSAGWVPGGDPNALTAEDLSATGTTVIDGGRIATGSITASQISAGAITTDKINTGAITADKINTGVLYNIGGNAASYTMKIDFTNGEIHIK